VASVSEACRHSYTTHTPNTTHSNTAHTSDTAHISDTTHSGRSPAGGTPSVTRGSSAVCHLLEVGSLDHRPWASRGPELAKSVRAVQRGAGWARARGGQHSQMGGASGRHAGALQRTRSQSSAIAVHDVQHTNNLRAVSDDSHCARVADKPSHFFAQCRVRPWATTWLLPWGGDHRGPVWRHTMHARRAPRHARSQGATRCTRANSSSDPRTSVAPRDARAPTPRGTQG